MILKRLFDILASFFGLLFLWPVLVIVAIMIKIKMPGGPAFFCQKRVGRGGKLFTCHKFRTMTVNHNGSSVSVAGDSRITPFGATLRHYKIDELPELWDVLIGNMSFVGPRPDVPGYADKLQGDDRVVLRLRPGITGPATLKYRLEDEMIADFVSHLNSLSYLEFTQWCQTPLCKNPLSEATFVQLKTQPDQEIAIWYNDNVIYPDKVRLNKYYYEHYFGGGLSGLIGLKGLIKDLQMIFATVLGFKVHFAGEEI